MTSKRSSILLGAALAATAVSIAAAPGGKRDDLASVAAACASCHGAAGEGNEARSAPKLAGLGAAYLAAALAKYRSGARGAHPGDLYGSQMRAVARTLKDDDDLRAMAALVAAQDERPAMRTVSGNVGNGRALYAACASCHGDKGEGDMVPGAPRLAYQPDWYIVTSLQAFRRDGRGFDGKDAADAQMAAMAKALPDDRAARDVAAYIATLRPPLKRRGRPAG